MLPNPKLSLIPLNDGNDFPKIGLASFRRDSLDETKRIILDAIDMGIRHFEISELFGNGPIISNYMFTELDDLRRNGDLLREDYWFTLKVWPKDKTKNELLITCRQNIRAMGLDYVDLILIHAPLDIKNRVEQWKALEQLKSEGLVKSIGIANINQTQLTIIIKNCSVAPSVCELEVTPFGQRIDETEYCIDNNTLILNNNFLGKNIFNTREELVPLAAEMGISVQEVCARDVA